MGEQVEALRNDRRLGLRNGDLSTVMAVGATSRAVTLDDGRRGPGRLPRRRPLGPCLLQRVQKAQGATVDRAFLLGSH